MPLESATYISDLVAANPTASDLKSQGDDQIRLVKSAIKVTFPNISGPVTATHVQLSYVTGVTSPIQTQIDLKAPLASPTLTGTPLAPTATPGNNSTQIATTSFVATSFAPIESPTFTGIVTVPTPTVGTSAANKAYADSLAFSAALPSQTGNAGKFVTTNGTTASWATAPAGGTIYTALNLGAL